MYRTKVMGGWLVRSGTPPGNGLVFVPCGSTVQTHGRLAYGSESKPFASPVYPAGQLFKDDLPTPALVLDLDRFEHNLKVVADNSRRTGCSFRPHAKTHKCPEIARRQLSAGALGVCAATVPE